MSRSAPKATSSAPRRTLWIVLILNLALTAGFAIGGWIADSSALLANALDGASDSFVFLLSLVAFDRGGGWKRGAARVSGITLLVFAVGILIDAVRRYLGGSEPLGTTILMMGVVGAIVNGLCLWLLVRLRHKDVNLRAATTFSFNDFASNGGVFVAGGLVMWTGANWPDLAVGALVAMIAVKGGIDILRDAHGEAKKRGSTEMGADHDHGGQAHSHAAGASSKMTTVPRKFGIENQTVRIEQPSGDTDSPLAAAISAISRREERNG